MLIDVFGTDAIGSHMRHARDAAKRLVEKYRGEIEATAAALAARGTLSGKDIARFLRPPEPPMTVADLCRHFGADPERFVGMSADAVRFHLVNGRARQDEALVVNGLRTSDPDDKPDPHVTPYAHRLSRLPLTVGMMAAAEAARRAMWSRAQEPSAP